MAFPDPTTLGLVLGLFLAALEASVVAPAMPTVVRELGGAELYALPFAVYLLLSTVSGPLWGRASDLYGRRRLYLASVLLFLLGSALSGLAQGMPGLILGRAIQGLGAGGVQPLTFTIAGELYPMPARARVQGLFSGVWGLSGLLGPSLGGLIVSYASWRWVFFLNLPFGLLALYLVGRAYRDRPQGQGALPWGPALAFALASGLLILGLQGDRRLALLGLLALGPALLYQARLTTSFLPLALLRGVRGGAFLGNLLAGAAYFGAVAYVPLFAAAKGAGPAAQGLLLTPMTLGWTSASILAARLLLRRPPEALTRLGFGLLTLGFLGYALAPGLPLGLAAPWGLLAGLGMGFSMLTLLLTAQEATPKEELGALTSALLFARSLGGAAGVALLGGLVGLGRKAGPELAQALGQAFLLSALLALLALLLTWRARGRPKDQPEG